MEPIGVGVPVCIPRDERPEAQPRERIAAVLPLRALDDGKRRLSARLSAAERRALIVWLCSTVVRALRESGLVDAIGIVSRDDATLRWAEEQGCAAVREQGDGLNDALVSGTDWTRGIGADAQLIVLPDLPLLRAEDVRAVVGAGAPTPGITICPDRVGSGTNMLLMRPCGAIAPYFGVGSFARHVEAARAAGVAVKVCDVPATRWDIDTPDDLDELVARF